MVSFSRIATVLLVLSAPFTSPAAPPEPTSWTIDGVQRQALVILPRNPGDQPAPVVLVFHGHGGSMQSFESKGFQRHWPEAIFVFPQGRPTVTLRDPKGLRSGWQPRLGENHDRDLQFVQAILKRLKEQHRIDDRRIYATGHSNGGGFTYLLMSGLNDQLAAIAPCAARAGGLQMSKDLKPIPVMHLAGRNDQIVDFEGQTRTMEAIRKFNGCQETGQPWTKLGDLVGTRYASENGSPFVSVIHSGTHRYPDQAPELIVKFFKEHTRK